jgi:hypothetical protein
MMRFLSVRKGLLAVSLITAPVALSGCATVAYGALEKFGIEKRDVLVDRVEDVAEAQGEAKEEFADALEAFRAVVDIKGGELEETYDRLSDSYDRADDRAKKVRSRIKDMKGVSRDLFVEWEQELGEYSDPGLRRASEQQLEATRDRYKVLVGKMDTAAGSMDPVLRVFKDRVLFLKHNLNARAIAALGGESAELEADVSALIADMERSIADADAFIAEMRSDGVS